MTPSDRQILSRVDVERHAKTGSLDFGQFIGVERANQSARAFVALEAHRRGKEAAAQKNGIAMPALPHGDGGKHALAAYESIDESVDEPGLYPRHVAQEHERSENIAGHGGQTNAQRRGEPAREFRIEGDANFEARDRGLHRVARVACDHDDRTRLGRQRRFHDPSHDRLAVKFRYELCWVSPAPCAKA
jgi:hypothetical protein